MSPQSKYIPLIFYTYNFTAALIYSLTIITTTTITSSSSLDKITERTEILKGQQNIVSNTKSEIDACIDYSGPFLANEIEELKKAFLDTKRRVVKLKYVTEITGHNVRYCKELVKMVDELPSRRY